MTRLRLHSARFNAESAGSEPRAALDGASRWVERLGSGLRRRVGWWWQQWSVGPRSPAVPAALAWLCGHGSGGCVAPRSGPSAPCPGLTGACLGTLWAYGQTTVALNWLDWLLSLQRRDGSFPDAGLVHASLFNTGQIARGLAALAGDWPAADAALERACRYLASRIDARGALRVPADGGSFDRWASPLVNLACLPALLQTARRLEEPDWEEAVWRAVRHAQRTSDLSRWNSSIRILAHGIHALVDLGCTAAACTALRLPQASQRRDGSVPAELRGAWTSSAGLAQLAVVWYKLGERQRADRAMAYLTARQRPSGGFLGSWGRGAGYYPNHEAAWTAKHYLDGALAQVQAAFQSWSPGVDDSLNDNDPRWQTVLAWSRQLPPDVRLADIGCGNGRYLRALAERLPHASLTGIDVSCELLERLPAGVNRQSGHLLRLPVADATYDAVLCVEAIEHSLLPEQAVAELCRVVRPGGSILIIDKNIARQPLARHEPWERWFAAEDVVGWLSEATEMPQATPLYSTTQATGEPVYFAWQARRRHSVHALPRAA